MFITRLRRLTTLCRCTTFRSMDTPADRASYHAEERRLASFHNWPNTSSMDPVRLSRSGFYYTGKSDTVRCFVCHIEISHWDDDDDPMAEHRRWSSRCPFLTTLPPGSGEVTARGGLALAAPPPARDVCGSYQASMTINREDGKVNAFPKKLNYLNKLGLTLVKKPIHPDFATKAARLATFNTWTNTEQDKEQLVEAGFYFIRQGDWTRCYHCNICVGEWQAGDDPWKEHAKWSPTCYFVSMVKGLAFINEATQSLPLTREVSGYLL